MDAISANDERVPNLIRNILDATPEICFERAVLLTQSYRETEGEPVVLRRAKALDKILSEMTVYIQEDELIVGNLASKPLSAPFFPEYGWEKSLDTLINERLDAYRKRGNSIIDELGISGKELNFITGNIVNLAKCLELALSNGIDHTGIQAGPATGDAALFESYDAVWDAFCAQVTHAAKMLVDSSEVASEAHRKIAPRPFMSALVSDCVSRGKTLLDGGARYNFISARHSKNMKPLPVQNGRQDSGHLRTVSPAVLWWARHRTEGKRATFWQITFLLFRDGTEKVPPLPRDQPQNWITWPPLMGLLFTSSFTPPYLKVSRESNGWRHSRKAFSIWAL
jgi:hypothetical protein